mmetsp:Transcript_13533/g.33779  ORF Transcript_13533/g.33779 Transcript_13533/m.33779 type:complete len:86 (+) Transcript_13533:1813-2070(+)
MNISQDFVAQGAWEMVQKRVIQMIIVPAVLHVLPHQAAEDRTNTSLVDESFHCGKLGAKRIHLLMLFQQQSRCITNDENVDKGNT